MRYKLPVLTERLPATPCTPQMRQEMENIARIQGISLADLQRQAVSLFLENFDTKSISHDTESSEKSA